MFDDLLELWRELGNMLADAQENHTDMHPLDVAEVLRNCGLKAEELTRAIAGRRQYVLELAPYWEGSQSGADAGMLPAQTQPEGALRLFVPRPGSATAAWIDRGSGIVGEDTGEPQILVDFEGNRHGSVNLRRYWERVAQAAARQVVRYPTIARSQVPREELIPVGWFDVATQEITLDEGPVEALAAWLNLTNRTDLLPGQTMRQPPLPGQEGPGVT